MEAATINAGPINRIDDHPFFADWSHSELALLHQAAIERNVAKDDIIFDIGSTELGFYLIMEGEVAFYAMIGEHLQEIDRRCSGNIFGEVSLLTRGPHRLRAVACTDCRLGFIPATSLYEYLGRLPMPLTKLLRAMTRHISQTSVARAEQAAKLEKMAVVGSMVNSIVHDFKSPFQMISLGAEMIGRLTADKQIRRISSTITDQVGRMLEMATELGEYSKGHSQFIYQRESLKTLIDEFISEQSVILEKGKVELSVEVPNIYFDVDSHRFLRAMMNLMSNAVEAMADGRGKIEIRASQTGDNQFELTFEDNGVGIPESIRNCFWEPFVTSGKTHGIGLGSAIVKNIIEGHNGTINFVTETGKGTKFIMVLPIRQPGSAH